MRRNTVVVVAATVIWLLGVSSEAFAQRNFSRSQQAGMQAYATQLQAQERARQQAQMGLVGRQFQDQQSQIAAERRRSDALLEYVQSAPGAGEAPQVRPRHASTFGNPYFGSPYFNNVQPYYNSSFVRTRSRQFSFSGTQSSLSN